VSAAAGGFLFDGGDGLIQKERFRVLFR